METVTIDENIRVGVAFERGKAMPVWFLWRGRYYKVKYVNYSWTTDLGAARLHYFSVTDGANMYELCFNSTSLEWTLSKVCAG